MTISSSRKRSNLKRVDLISELPDHLLCHILAFLPTRSAMATSVLSRRWEYVWTGVPVLNLTYDDGVILYDSSSIAAARQYQSLKYYMNRVLLHNSATCLEQVDFEIFPVMTEKDLQEWFKMLSRRSVNEVSLFYNHSCSAVPITILLDGILGKHLVALTLDAENECTLDVAFASRVHLPCLEKIHLSRVEISHDSEPLTSLIRSSPHLRELSILECDGAINFSCSTLKILKISVINYIIGSMKVPNLEYFELNPADMFYCEGNCHFLTGDMPYLTEAKVGCHLNVAMWSDLFQTIRHVINLDISIYPCTDCDLQENTPMHLKLPYFDRLKCLEIHCYEEHSIRQTSLFLRHMPNCVSLIIHMGPAPCNSFAELELKGWPEVDSLGLEFHVEYIEIDGFDPDRLVIIEVLKYLLVCCTRLKELKLHMRKWWVAEQKNAMRKTIMELSRPSGCKIVIDERMW